MQPQLWTTTQGNHAVMDSPLCNRVHLDPCTFANTWEALFESLGMLWGALGRLWEPLGEEEEEEEEEVEEEEEEEVEEEEEEAALDV